MGIGVWVVVGVRVWIGDGEGNTNGEWVGLEFVTGVGETCGFSIDSTWKAAEIERPIRMSVETTAAIVRFFFVQISKTSLYLGFGFISFISNHLHSFFPIAS